MAPPGRLSYILHTLTLQPKLFTTLQDYDARQLRSDVLAGIIVGIVAVPLAIAFAIASGVAPQYGLYTAIIGGFIVSAFGGSRVQIAGPTGAFVVVVYGVLQQHGPQGLLVATMMAGVILVALGIGRLGGAIKFVPHPVVTGFTAGIAIIIATSQIPDLFGLRMEDVPADFIEKWAVYSAHWSTFNLDAVLLSAISLVIITAWPRLSHRPTTQSRQAPRYSCASAPGLSRCCCCDAVRSGRFAACGRSRAGGSTPRTRVATRSSVRQALRRERHGRRWASS